MDASELKKQVIFLHGSVSSYAKKIKKNYANVLSVLNGRLRNDVIESIITKDFGLEEDFFDLKETSKKIKKFEIAIKNLGDLKRKIVYDFGSLVQFCRENNIDNAELSKFLQRKVKNSNIEKVLKENYNLPKKFFD